jgi:hypothetical protein
MQQQQQQTGTPLIGTYHRRGESKKQELVAQARPWRRQKKRIDLHKKNILPFSVSARRFGFGPSPFPARLVIVVVGSSRALGGGFVGFSKNPRFRFFQHCTIKEPPPYCMEFFVYEGRAFKK